MTIYKRQLKLTQLGTSVVGIDAVVGNLRLDDAEETELVERLARLAVKYVEEHAGKKLNPDHYDYTIPALSGREVVVLPITPIFEITGISYYDTDNVQQTIELSNLYILIDEDCCSIVPLNDVVWPELYDRADALTISFVSGYASHLEQPENLIQAAIVLASCWFENRSPTGSNLSIVPEAVTSLINISKIGWYG